MPDHLDSLLTLKDYKGQTLTEHMFQDLTLFYGTWIYLWVCGSTVWVGYIIMAGFALLHLLMFPSWPIYRRHPLMSSQSVLPQGVEVTLSFGSTQALLSQSTHALRPGAVPSYKGSSTSPTKC